VHGKVLFEGRPMSRALVVFHRLDGTGQEGAKPRAIAEPDGSFKVFTRLADDGAPAGEYAVTVSWKKNPEPRSSRVITSKEVRRQVNAARQAEKKMLREIAYPARYQNPGTSGLRVRVEPKLNELTSFNLTK
jgi:hypothetical protein